jgi:hypothetical protein
MGRRRRDADPTEVERTRRVPRTVSIPKYVNDELMVCQNPSSLITLLLEENLERIGGFTLEDGVRVREQHLKELIEEKMLEVFDNSLKPAFERIVQDVLKSYALRVRNEAGEV